MTKEEIEKQYQKIKQYYDKYLKTYKVALPNLYNKKGNYTKDALVLIKLSENYPNTKTVTKQELTQFMQKYCPDTVDVQQARHLSMQKGWYISSGTRGDSNIPKNSYKLITLENPYPSFSPNRREGFDGNFEEIKKRYGNRCATCGSKEGTKHLFRKSVIVELQEGHMNPAKPLQEGNIIPQCQICNRPDRNKWIFDKTGRVIEIATTHDGVRIVKTFLKNADKKIRKEILEYIKSLLK